MRKATAFTAYLVFDQSGVQRMAKGKPGLKRGEHAVRVVLSVPPSVFERDIPTATISVPEVSVIHPTVEVAAPLEEQ